MDSNKQNQPHIKVTKDGPYEVTGSVPLAEQKIRVDEDSQCHGWAEGKRYPVEERYSLCRCGASKHKPFCDGTHAHIEWDGTETAGNTPFDVMAKEFEGPGLRLHDAEELCATARFCHRAGSTWDLVRHSDDPLARQTAIEESCDCPSGRLVACEKDGRPIEPDLEPSIGVIEDTQKRAEGPLWVRGGAPSSRRKGSPTSGETG
jgi:CDGSH-type Zn-finger protein